MESLRQRKEYVLLPYWKPEGNLLKAKIMKVALLNLKMKEIEMSTHDRRIFKLEKESKYRNTEHLLLVQRYPGQSLEEAVEQAGISSENEHGFQIVFMTAQDAATL